MAHHAVDDNNNNRQGALSFEDVFLSKSQENRQFGFIVASTVTNAHLVYNFFVYAQQSKPNLNKAEFICSMAWEMVNNADWKQEMEREDGNSERRDSTMLLQHEIVHLLKGNGKWDGSTFRETKQDYQKYHYSGKCRTMCHTYCVCNKSAI